MNHQTYFTQPHHELTHPPDSFEYIHWIPKAAKGSYSAQFWSRCLYCTWPHIILCPSFSRRPIAKLRFPPPKFSCFVERAEEKATVRLLRRENTFLYLTLLAICKEKVLLPEIKWKFLHDNVLLPPVGPRQFIENTFNGKSLTYCLCKERGCTVY